MNLKFFLGIFCIFMMHNQQRFRTLAAWFSRSWLYLEFEISMQPFGVDVFSENLN
jgi:hypothetical protein